MNNELDATEITSILIDEELAGGIISNRHARADVGLVRTIRDVASARAAVSPEPEFRQQLLEEIRDQLAQPVGRSNAAHGWWRFSANARQWRVAVAALTLLLALGTAGWFSPVRAQIGRIVCYLPGLGIRTCDSTGLVIAAPVSVTRGNQTLTVTRLLSSGGQTLVNLTITVDPVAYDQLDKLDQLGMQMKVSLRDSNGKQYAALRQFLPFGADVQQLPVPKSTLLLHQAPFAPLDPQVGAVDVQVSGPPAIGDWTVHVLVEPPSGKTVTIGQSGGSSATVQGITVTVAGVATDSEHTTIQLTGTPGPQFSEVLSFTGALQGPPYFPYPAVLRDDKGRTYKETRVDYRLQPRADPHIEDLQFERVADDARSASLELPYVLVQEPTEPVSVTVPLVGRHLNDSFTIGQEVALGSYHFTVTDGYIAEVRPDDPPGSGLNLDLSLELGDWRNGRRLQSPGVVEVNHQRPPGIQFLVGGPQWNRLGVPIPTNPPSDVILTFRNPRVAIQGPWRLAMPG